MRIPDINFILSLDTQMLENIKLEVIVQLLRHFPIQEMLSNVLKIDIENKKL